MTSKITVLNVQPAPQVSETKPPLKRSHASIDHNDTSCASDGPSKRKRIEKMHLSVQPTVYDIRFYGLRRAMADAKRKTSAARIVKAFAKTASFTPTVFVPAPTVVQPAPTFVVPTPTFVAPAPTFVQPTLKRARSSIVDLTPTSNGPNKRTKMEKNHLSVQPTVYDIRFYGLRRAMADTKRKTSAARIVKAFAKTASFTGTIVAPAPPVAQPAVVAASTLSLGPSTPSTANTDVVMSDAPAPPPTTVFSALSLGPSTPCTTSVGVVTSDASVLSLTSLLTTLSLATDVVMSDASVLSLTSLFSGMTLDCDSLTTRFSQMSIS